MIDEKLLNFIVGITALSMIFILGLIFVILFAKLAKEEQRLKNKKLKLEIKNLEYTLDFKQKQNDLVKARTKWHEEHDNRKVD